MYLKFLKNDLRRKRIMNTILLIFVCLSSMFIASGINNIHTIMSATDKFIAKSEFPDSYIIYFDKTNSNQQKNKFQNFLNTDKDIKSVKQGEAVGVPSNDNIYLNDKKLTGDFSADFIFGSVESTMLNLFQEDGSLLEKVNDGEIFLSPSFANIIGAKIGDKLEIRTENYQKTFTVVGKNRDIVFGVPTVTIQRAIISENDYSDLANSETVAKYKFVGINTDNLDRLNGKISELDFSILVNYGKAIINTVYYLELVIAGVFLVVSLVLVIISFVILRFTISFTI
ncbi:MAG: hypothetical protein LBM93_00275, partial [Oscillospiraceae bacterium]|nr:hypothetical protein [Oscillospiraceae bacterium]